MDTEPRGQHGLVPGDGGGAVTRACGERSLIPVWIHALRPACGVVTGCSFGSGLLGEAKLGRRLRRQNRDVFPRARGEKCKGDSDAAELQLHSGCTLARAFGGAFLTPGAVVSAPCIACGRLPRWAGEANDAEGFCPGCLDSEGSETGMTPADFFRAGRLASARALLRVARAGFHRPGRDERPRCGAKTRSGPCQGAAIWLPGEPRPRRRCAKHARRKS